MIYVFLQNAYSEKHAGEKWINEKWREALKKSRTGQRLPVLLKGIGQYEIFNTTPIAGAKPNDKLPPDIPYIKRILKKEPDMVVCCGDQAIHTIKSLWDGPIIGVPHPAHRYLSNNLYKKANGFLKRKTSWHNRVLFKQMRGSVIKYPFPV